MRARRCSMLALMAALVACGPFPRIGVAAAVSPQAQTQAEAPTSKVEAVPTAYANSLTLSREFAVEKAMGARCMEDDSWAGRRERPFMIERYCVGPMPRKLREVLVAIPDGEMELSRQLITQSTEEPVKFAAVRGLGRGPDFLVEARSWWLRSFESPDPRMTVYWVNGRFNCRPDSFVRKTTDNVRCFGSSIVPTSRIYRMTGSGKLVDVTSNVLPNDPAFPFVMSLDSSKLQFVPVMRWTRDFDPEYPLPASAERRAFKGNAAHFGFLVWDGGRFKLEQRVPRRLWPCKPVQAGRPPCSFAYDSPTDKFVIDETQTPSKEGAHDR